MPTATINGMQLAFADVGPRAGVPVILLHAFPLRGAQWQAQADALAQTFGSRVIVPDLRGFGGSDAPPGPYPMELLARDVLGLADALGVDQFVLGGISLGGYVAFALLRLAPQRVQALILADTRAETDSEGGLANRESLAQQAEREGATSIAELMLPKLLSANGVSDPAIAGPVRAMIEGTNPVGIAAASRGMAQRPDSSDLLPQVRCPALVIVGELDMTTPIHEARTMFERIPDAKLEVLRDAGHLSNLEAPEAFNMALIHFLQTHPVPEQGLADATDVNAPDAQV